MIRLTTGVESAPIFQLLVHSLESVEVFLFLATATLLLLAFSGIMAVPLRYGPGVDHLNDKADTNADAFLPVPRGLFDQQTGTPIQLNG